MRSVFPPTENKVNALHYDSSLIRCRGSNNPHRPLAARTHRRCCNRSWERRHQRTAVPPSRPHAAACTARPRTLPCRTQGTLPARSTQDVLRANPL